MGDYDWGIGCRLTWVQVNVKSWSYEGFHQLETDLSQTQVRSLMLCCIVNFTWLGNEHLVHYCDVLHSYKSQNALNCHIAMCDIKSKALPYSSSPLCPRHKISLWRHLEKEKSYQTSISLKTTRLFRAFSDFFISVFLVGWLAGDISRTKRPTGDRVV